jgi:hypothetical protein
MLKPINSKSEKVRRGRGWMINFINDRFLKPQYQIVPTLNESDDDWDLEADEEWNIKDLTAGDYITQEMLNDTPFTKAWRQLNQDIKIVGFKKGPFMGDNLFVVEYIDEWNETRQNDIDIESFNKYFLKPGYRIIPPLNEQQDDDDWDLEAGDEWNVTELGIGDHITLDMLNQDNQPHLKHFLAVFEPNTFPLLIDKGNFNNYVVLRPEKGGRGRIWTIKVMNNIFLKPEYQIVFP